MVPLAVPLGVLLGIPLGVPIGIPFGVPLALPLGALSWGSLLGFPLGVPFGGPLGVPLIVFPIMSTPPTSYAVNVPIPHPRNIKHNPKTESEKVPLVLV